MVAKKRFNRHGPANARKGVSPRKDHYFFKAKRESFAARAVYKLEQIDTKYTIFKNGQRILDLGCHPGSWMQYASRKVGNKGLVVGVDRTETVLLLPNIRSVCQDIYECDSETLGEPAHSFDVVLSDMAPNTCGIKSVDQLKSSSLAEKALDLALTFCKQGGHFVVKVFMGPDEPVLYKNMREHFTKVARYKPDASRSVSMEIYLVGIDRKTGAAD